MRSGSGEATLERLETTTTFAAALLPLAVYVATSTAFPYWLDSPEFTAAAVDLDIPHPPGHPLACMWGKLFALLPIGPLPFRVAVGQASAAALALAALQRAIARTLEQTGLTRAGMRLSLSLGFTLALAASHAYWFQSVRAEVYALQAALVCFAFERCTAFVCAACDDSRKLYLAAFALGLGLANHHLVAFLAFPPVFGLALWAPRTRTWRSLAWSALGLACGTATYAYLPIRASTGPTMDLGHPVSWRALIWVVSARPYAHSYGSEAVQPMDERFADLAVILVENLTPTLLVLAVLGGYALLRARRTWPLAYLWLSAAACNLLVRAWLGPIRSNPDMLGYMMPGMAALSALAAVGGSAVLRTLSEHRAMARPALAASLLLAALGAARALETWPANDLAAFRATDAFDVGRRRDLPPGAVVFLTTAQTTFVHWGASASEDRREDLLMVPVPFLNYGERGQLLAARHPEIAASIEEILRTGQLSLGSLSELARRRPVFVEADLDLALPLVSHLVPEGLLYRLLPEPVSPERLALAADAHRVDYAQLYAALGDDVREIDTRKQLLWLHYVDAVYFALQGRRDAALRVLEGALALFPLDRTANRFAAALRALGDGPLDVRPYLMKSQRR
jgi:hypothetical protein